MSDFTPIICVDFDGVIHSYSSGWKGADIIRDAPVRGAIEWLEDLLREGEFKPVIYSARSSQEGGIDAMKTWLFDHGMDIDLLDQLEFPTQKPSAFLTIDDRALCFDGKFPSAADMKTFTPWYKDPAPKEHFSVPPEQNFCRVFELPPVFSQGYLHGGGQPSTFLELDWFNPVPDPSFSPAAPEHDTWESCKAGIIKFLQEKRFFRPDRTYLVLTYFGESFTFGAPLRR